GVRPAVRGDLEGPFAVQRVVEGSALAVGRVLPRAVGALDFDALHLAARPALRARQVGGGDGEGGIAEGTACAEWGRFHSATLPARPLGWKVGRATPPGRAAAAS